MISTYNLPPHPPPNPLKLVVVVGAVGPDYYNLILNLRDWGRGCGGVFCKGKGLRPLALSPTNLHPKKNPTMYLRARPEMIIPKPMRITLPEKNFCRRAPRYMPTKPPTPKRAPRAQSGAIPMP